MHNESHVLLMKRETQPTVFGTSTYTLIKIFLPFFLLLNTRQFFLSLFPETPFCYFSSPSLQPLFYIYVHLQSKIPQPQKYYIHKQQAALIFFKAYMDKIATKRTFWVTYVCECVIFKSFNEIVLNWKTSKTCHK